jgi:pyridoxamine 5'-phosphate oxidase
VRQDRRVADDPDPADPAVDPIEVLASWLTAARDAGAELPEAVTLATITPDGWPSARLVILRGLDHGLVFFTDRESDKGADLAAHPRAAIVLHWLVPEHRQVRVVGDVEPAGDRADDDYWRSRRPDARRSAAASVQSRVIAGRDELEARVAELARRYPDGTDLPRPGRWGGYRVVPAIIEFWEEAPDGLHERLRYHRVGASWRVSRLSP